MLVRRTAQLVWLAICGASLPVSLSGQVPQPLPVDDVLHLRRSSGPIPFEFSPDGKWLAYTVCEERNGRPADDYSFLRTGVPWNGFGCDVYVISRVTDTTRNVTGGHGNNWMPAWSPDGRYLAFLSDRSQGQARVWLWDRERDEIRQVSDLPLRMEQPVAWTRDNQHVVVTTVPIGVCLEDYLGKVIYGEGQAQGSVAGTATKPSVVQYRSRGGLSGTGRDVRSDSLSLDGAMRDLVVVNIASPKTRALVTGTRIGFFVLSKDDSSVAYSSPRRLERAGSQQVLYDFGVATLATGTNRVVASGIRLSFAGRFSLSLDGSELAYRTGGAERGAMNMHVIDLASGADREMTHFESGKAEASAPKNPVWPSSLTPLWGTRDDELYCIVGGSLWRMSSRRDSASELARIDGKKVTKLIAGSSGSLWTTDQGRSTVVFTHDDGTKQEGLYKIDLRNGEATRLLERDECYTCTEALEGHFAAGTDDGNLLVYIAEAAGHAAEIRLSGMGFEEPRQLTRLNPKLDQYQMGAAKLIDWLDDDGKRLSGALLLPSSYRKGKRYPLVVFVYGGVNLSDTVNHFGGPMSELPYYNLQLLATRGYAVLVPDAPQREGTPMLDLAKTILPAVNKTIELGVADPERLGVMGQSYGGYSTLCLLVETNRFKAAVESDGTADLVGHYGQMDSDGTAFGTSVEETGQGLMGGTPWERRERYIENSPVFYFDRMTTPLLVVHGARDTTVSAFLGDQIFVSLRRLGREVEYAKYEGEGHTVASDANRRDVCNRVIGWFDAHLKGESEEAATSP